MHTRETPRAVSNWRRIWLARSWMVSWWTVVRQYQSYCRLQRRNAPPVPTYKTCLLQTDNAFITPGAETRASSSSAGRVHMIWLWMKWSIRSSAWTYFKMEKANAALLTHVDAVSQIATRWRTFRRTIGHHSFRRFLQLQRHKPVPTNPGN